MYENDELTHYGVPGMKWGKRKANYISVRQGNKNRKKAYKEAYIDSTKKSGGKTVSGLGVTVAVHPNLKAKRNAKAAGKAAARESVKNDKAYNKQRRDKINKLYKEIQKGSSFTHKMVYNNATRKRAAKYMVDNNMSMADAQKRANKDAIRNTSILLAACGGMLAVEVAKNRI